VKACIDLASLITMRINRLETDRAYTQAVKEVPQLRDCERCWAETATNWEQYDAITEEMAETVCTEICTTQIYYS
jgi:hypothetical protein